MRRHIRLSQTPINMAIDRTFCSSTTYKLYQTSEGWCEVQLFGEFGYNFDSTEAHEANT